MKRERKYFAFYKFFYPFSSERHSRRYFAQISAILVANDLATSGLDVSDVEIGQMLSARNCVVRCSVNIVL